jgi:hypothetical protein
MKEAPMTWYAAHIVMYVKLKEKAQEHFPVWENIVLIHADSEEDAFAKTEARGHEEEGDCEGSFRWGGQQATWIFAGVRKLVLCQDSEERPRNGTELTYNEMHLESKEALARFVKGQPVDVRYQDRFRPTSHDNAKKKIKPLAKKKPA